jgi:muramoyltetrapeptide carboxypeptidase LdcA involved in peptidoglycan recycling
MYIVKFQGVSDMIMVLNATFNNISVISSVLLVEESQRKPPTCRKSLTNLITLEEFEDTKGVIRIRQ